MEISIVENRIKSIFLLLALFLSSPIWADASYQDVIDWVSAESGEVSTAEAGQYGHSELDQLRNLIPPGYFGEFEFPELSIETVSYTHLTLPTKRIV